MTFSFTGAAIGGLAMSAFCLWGKWQQAKDAQAKAEAENARLRAELDEKSRASVKANVCYGVE